MQIRRAFKLAIRNLQSRYDDDDDEDENGNNNNNNNDDDVI